MIENKTESGSCQTGRFKGEEFLRKITVNNNNTGGNYFRQSWPKPNKFNQNFQEHVVQKYGT